MEWAEKRVPWTVSLSMVTSVREGGAGACANSVPAKRARVKSRTIPLMLANGSATLEARGTKDLLDHFYDLGVAGGLGAAPVVGAGSHHSHLFPKLVDRLPQRLVLKLAR